MPGANYKIILTMETDNMHTEPQQDKKYSGGIHFFLFFGGLIVVLILIKLLIDYLT